MKRMPVPRYRYRRGGHDSTLVMGQGDEPYRFHTEAGSVYPLAPDDLIQLDTPEAAFLAQEGALVAAWRDLGLAAADLPEPEAARHTLRTHRAQRRRVEAVAPRVGRLYASTPGASPFRGPRTGHHRRPQHAARTGTASRGLDRRRRRARGERCRALARRPPLRQRPRPHRLGSQTQA
jgi:hypothetical protein